MVEIRRYIIHRWRMVRGRYLYILGAKGQEYNRTLSTLWFWHDKVFNEQLSYFIHRCRMVRRRYLCILGSKGQGHDRILSTLWLWHDSLRSFQSTYIDVGWWDERYLCNLGSKGQGHNWTWSKLWFFYDSYIVTYLRSKIWKRHALFHTFATFTVLPFCSLLPENVLSLFSNSAWPFGLQSIVS